ncbi:hypothetical protein CVT26_006140 [Gymnopilus dilepis]|uniref:Uncharacterized protein n=1 Tax=Gymnopilus dilepis TaxID=231916 RepID=A0A409WG38_9AGAR|nr:hypothetical protein CVT26_006140 [Gymnopilus dilepis]
MVNPGAFRGSRKEFLISQKAAYAEAVVGGYVADALADIQRKYFKRYPVDLAHDEEPSEEHLAAVDDNAPDPEIPDPDRSKLTDEEYLVALAEVKERGLRIRYRKAQIKRWMAYQYMKDQDTDSSPETASNASYNAVISQMLGKEPGRPRRKTAVNVWRKTQRHEIETKVKELAAAQGTAKDHLAALRDKVARDMFNALPSATKEIWTKKADQESEAALAKWKQEFKDEPSLTPAERQKCIQALTRVSQPILDAFAKTTGWKVTLLAGGPEPADGGKLNIISVHSGFTTGPIKMNFGRSERADYKRAVVPVFGKFLKKCYTPEDCRSSALDTDEGVAPLSEAELETNGATLDGFDDLDSGESRDANAMDVDVATSTPQPCTSSQPPTTSSEPPPTTSSISSSEPPPANASIESSSPMLPAEGISSLPPPEEDPATPPLDQPPSPPPACSATPPRALSNPAFPQTPSRAPSSKASSLETPPESPSSPTSSLPRREVLLPVLENPAPATSGAESTVTPSWEALPPDLPDVQMACPSNGDRLDIESESEPFPFRIISPPARASSVSLTPPPSPPRSPAPTSRQLRPDHHSPPAPAQPQPPSTELSTSSESPSTTPPVADLPPSLPSSTGSPTLEKAKADATKASPAKRSSTENSDTRLRKRSRTSLASTPSSTGPAISSPGDVAKIPKPPAAPAWFCDALTMLQANDLGQEWRTLLESWLELEVNANFKERGKLGTRFRPTCVGDWIQRRRSTTWRPAFDLPDMEKKFFKWWASLQPEWRILEDERINFSAVDGDWEDLRRTGLNGLYSLFVALFYWGINVAHGTQAYDRWLDAVRDVQLACNKMVESIKK